MTTLDEILSDIHAVEKAIFNFPDELEITMAKIEQLGFRGQVDHNAMYMSMLHQIRNDKTGEIHTLTLEEADQFYNTGDVVGWDYFEPFAWTFWFFNMDKNYIRALVSFHADAKKSPKENYGIMYNELKPNVARQIKRPVIYETTIDTSGYSEVWNKLKEAVQYGKNNIIKKGGFADKIEYDTATVFATKRNTVENLVDDEYKETMRPEIIKLLIETTRMENVKVELPEGGERIENKMVTSWTKSNFKHGSYDVEDDLDVLAVIRGASFKQIDYEGDGYIKEFGNITDMNSYFYSIIDYINEHKNELPLNGQVIPAVEKHYLSNKLPFEDGTKLYRVKMTKFIGKFAMEAEVAEFGVYYTISYQVTPDITNNF
jgi:hypothetical protein